MIVSWTHRAVAHLRSLEEYVSQDSPAAATQIADRLISLADRLGRFPEMGRRGRVRGTREMPVPGTPFILAYRVRAQSLVILAVLHAARQWPDQL